MNRNNMERLKHLHSIIADQAYNSPGERQQRIMGYDLMGNVNTVHEVGYINDQVGHIVVGFRGTWDSGDISSDIAIVRGRERGHPRFKKSLALVNHLRQQYPDYKITVTGHSLGGRIADIISRDTGLRAFTFNRGAGMASLWENPNKRAIEYRTNPDLVSFLNKTHTHITDSKFKDPIRAHSSTNFLPEMNVM